jgi:PAS domain S-box-containing protein
MRTPIVEAGSPGAADPGAPTTATSLRASESRYRRLFETAQDGILLLNADTAQVEDVNPYLIEMLGYSHQEILGKKLWEMGAFADVAQSKDMFAILQTQGFVRYDDLPLKTHEGKRVEVEFVSNSYDCEGIKVIQCNIRNISDRRHTERALADSEARTRRLLQAANVGLWDWNLLNDAVYLSPEWKSQLGFSDGEIDNSLEAWQSRIHPDDLRATLGAVHDFRLGLRPRYEVEFRMQHKDDSWRWISARADIARDAEGTALRMMGSHFDITRQVHNRDAIREAQNSLSAIINAAMDAIIAVGLDERIVIFSAAAERLFRATAAEMMGQPLELLIPHRYRSAHHAHIRRFADDRQSARTMGKFGRLTALRRDGSEFPIEASISHIPTTAGQLFTVTIRDISEREAADAARGVLEAQLRESQKMEAIGLLAGGIAHDFNNIVTTILGNAELAAEDVREIPQAVESLEEIRKAGTRARELTQQILSFSRRQPTDLKSIALGPTIAESVRLLRSVMPSRVRLEFHAEEFVPHVLADAVQIQQVLINLANNSLHAMHSRPGHIDIRLDSIFLDARLTAANAGLQALSLRDKGRVVRVTVTDDGPGMDDAILGRIFEPFFTTKSLGEGTGLGLSVVHGIVQSHHGVVTVESPPNRGAIFTLYFPVADAPAGVAELTGTVPVLDSGPHPAKRILYIDDESALIFLVKRILERRGFQVSGHTSPREALALLRADPSGFDVVITDYNMPGMSGMDVAREVRDIRADMPIAVASGFLDEALRARAHEAGVQELMFKATELRDFCAQIQRLAESSDPRPAAAGPAIDAEPRLT